MKSRKGAGLRQQSGWVGNLNCEVQNAVVDYTLCGRCRKRSANKVASDERSAMGSLPFLVGSVPAD